MHACGRAGAGGMCRRAEVRSRHAPHHWHQGGSWLLQRRAPIKITMLIAAHPLPAAAHTRNNEWVGWVGRCVLYSTTRSGTCDETIERAIGEERFPPARTVGVMSECVRACVRACVSE